MEVPAYTLFIPFVSKIGRRPSTAGNFFLTGICMLALSRTPNGKHRNYRMISILNAYKLHNFFVLFLLVYETVRMILAMLAKLFISCDFAVIYLLGAELYPTELRTTGLAVGVFCGRLGSITAPYIADLMVRR